MEKKYVSVTKISYPTSHNVFLRKRLFCLLDRCRENPIICVCCPVGYGKTTLLSSHMEKRSFPSLWYQLDSVDICIETFFYKIGLTTAKLSQHKRKPLPQLTTEYQLVLQSFTQLFFQGLYSHLKIPSIIVFYNLQEALPVTKFHKVCNGLYVIPEGITIILINRNICHPTLDGIV